MARIRIASCIIASLSFLRILPNGKKNFIDMFGLCFWTTFAILASGIGWRMLVDTIKNLLDAGYIKTITGVFSIMSIGLLPFLVVLAFPLLAYFGRHYPMLVKENSLPFPHQPLLFAAVMLLGTNYLAFVVMDILKTQINVQTVCMIVLNTVSCLTFFIQMFIIGVSTEVVFRKASIDCKEDITVTTVNYCTGVVSEFKALKKALSPLLLTVVGSQTAFRKHLKTQTNGGGGRKLRGIACWVLSLSNKKVCVVSHPPSNNNCAKIIYTVLPNQILLKICTFLCPIKFYENWP